MQIILWAISLIAIAIAIWSVFLLSNERRQSASFRKTLRGMAVRVQSLEEDIKARDEARNATEEKLRGYLELLDTLINAMPNPIYFKDAAGIFQGCNRMFARSILGLTRPGQDYRPSQSGPGGGDSSGSGCRLPARRTQDDGKAWSACI